VKIFSGTSNKALAQKIAENLNTPLSDLEVFVFPDGEKRIRILDKVLGENVFIVQSTSAPADENYMQLFFIIDALKRAGAKSTKAIIPYLGYQRQDHLFREGEAVSLDVVANLLKLGGVDEVISLDLHSIKIPEVFKVKLTHLSVLTLFAEKIRKMGNDITLVSPDMGGIRRIKLLSKLLGDAPYVIIEKNRDLGTGRVTANKIQGILSKKAIIVDDMISRGDTITMAADLLISSGAEEVSVFATHPVFSNNAPKTLQESKTERICVTDTISVPEEKRFPKLEVISVSRIIAENIKSA